MAQQKVTRRGVYKDLTLSPYEYQTPYGDSFKFSSQKRLEIYTRDIQKEVDRLKKTLDRYNLADQIPDEINVLIFRSLYRSFYRHVER